MPTGVPIQRGQEWTRFNICYDTSDKQYAVRHECKVCGKQSMSEGLTDKAAVGNKVAAILKSPICNKCTDLFSKYQAALKDDQQ